jgi:EmrB/QacA subfamily drug resistance transporter
MVMGAMSLALIVITLDLSALNVALPSMERAFHSDISTMQWALNGYALTFAVLLVAAGRLADLLGRRRVFFAGTALFALTALLGGLATDEWWVIAARAGMGVAGALMLPAATGIVYTALPAERAGLAGAVVVGSFGIGQSIGPLIGGVLTEYLSWRWVFFVDVPAAALAIFVTWRAVHEEKRAAVPQKLDYGGIATLTLSLVALLFALDQGSDWGWGSARVLGVFGLSVVALVAFVFAERRAGESALLPPDVVANRAFAAVSLCTLLAAPIFFSALFYLPQFLNKQLGYSPFKMGIGTLPFMGALALASFAAGPVYGRVGVRLTIAFGLAAMVVGSTLLGFASGSYRGLVPGMILLGTGLAFFASSVTTAAVTAVSASERSLAGGIVFTIRVGGGALGLGLMTAIVVSSSEGHAGGFLSGFRDGFRLNAGLALLSLLVALVVLKRTGPAG